MNSTMFWPLVGHSLFTFFVLSMVFLNGRAMLLRMKRLGQHRRAYHGKFVWYSMLLGGLLGSLAAPFASSPGYMATITCFGLLVGWLFGMIPGAILLAVHGVPPPSAEPDLDETD
jgi:hypothetical protein